MKKSKRDIKQQRTKKQLDEKLISVNPEEFQENEQMEYGGLPKRDLKKNLGCG